MKSAKGQQIIFCVACHILKNAGLRNNVYTYNSEKFYYKIGSKDAVYKQTPKS